MPGDPSRRWALSSDLASLGPFFAVETHVRGESMPPPWQPMTTLVEGAALAARIDAVRTALAHRAGGQPADVEIRVAASVTHLGLIARILSVAIGAIALGHTPFSLSLDDVWWQNELGGPYPLSVAPTPTTEVPGAGPAVEAITTAIAERYAVSHQVLWGNIGSAANSAAQLISTARADLKSTAHAAADAVLTDPRVDGGTVRPGPSFRRRSCCLIYRIANDRTATCGDCILR
jgi:FhuF 2Fe-2S C-terminal domain